MRFETLAPAFGLFASLALAEMAPKIRIDVGEFDNAQRCFWTTEGLCDSKIPIDSSDSHRTKWFGDYHSENGTCTVTYDMGQLCPKVKSGGSATLSIPGWTGSDHPQALYQGYEDKYEAKGALWCDLKALTPGTECVMTKRTAPSSTGAPASPAGTPS